MRQYVLFSSAAAAAAVGWLVAYQSHHQSSVKERHDVRAPGTRARAVLFGPAGRGRIECLD